MTEIYKDQKVFFDGYDMTGVTNALGLDYSADAIDETTLGDDTRINKGGLKVVTASLNGFFEPTEDKVIYDTIGAADKVLTISRNGTEGQPAYTFKAMKGSYSPGASVGELFSFSLDVLATGNLVRGTLMENNTAVTANGDGTAQQLGAVAAGKKMYAALHVLGASGTSPTLDVTIESDATNTFAGGETTRITFTQATVIGGQWQEVDGAITDQWWRVSYTIGGTSPDFDFIVVLGIL